MTRQPGGRNPRTSEVVAESIRSRVARGELKAGDRFPAEDQLMAVFGIARTTLREALRILETEGLVTVLRGRHGGPRVTSPSLDHLARMFDLLARIDGVTARDVHAAREVVEPPLVAAFTRTRSPQALVELQATVEAIAAAARAGDVPAMGRASSTLHTIVTTQGGNRTLGLLARLLHQVAACSAQTSPRPLRAADRHQTVGYYRRFHEFVEAGDVAGACAHWRSSMIHSADAVAGEAADQEISGTMRDTAHDSITASCH